MDAARIIAAWRDPDRRAETAGDEHPSGLIQLPDAELEKAAGGSTELVCTFGCCSGVSSADTCACFTSCGPSTNTDYTWCF